MPGKVIEKASDMLSAGQDLIKGLIEGIKNMGASAVEAVAGVVDGVVEKAKSLLKISSPSKLFEQFGAWTSEGLAKGIDKMRNLAEKASENLGLGVEGAFEPQLTVDGVKGLSKLKGINVNSLIGNLAPSSLQVQQSVIHSQSRQNRYDDSEVVKLLKIIAEKDPDLYMGIEKVGGLLDKEQARRIKLLEGWVAID